MLSLMVSDNNEVLDLVKIQIQPLINQNLTAEQQEAQENHYSFVKVAELGKNAGLALRIVAAKMWITQGYKELQVPYPNDPTQTLSFDDFESWIGFAVEQAGLGEGTNSALKTFIVNVIDPVAKRVIHNPETHQPYTVDEVLSLREAHTQKLGVAAKRTLKNPDLTDDEKYDQIAQLIEIAARPNIDQHDFVDELRERSLSNRRNEPFEVKIARVNGKTVYQIIVPELKEPMVNTTLDGRSRYSDVLVDDLMDELMAIQVKPEDLANVSPIEQDLLFTETVDNSEPTDQDLNNWLGEQ